MNKGSIVTEFEKCVVLIMPVLPNLRDPQIHSYGQVFEEFSSKEA